MENKCGWDDNCPHVATMVPKLIFPAKGWKLSDHDPMAMIMSVKICGPCLKKMKMADFIGPEMDGENNNIRSILEIVTRDKCPIDYDRAYIEGVPLASKEWREYERALAKTETAGTA